MAATVWWTCPFCQWRTAQADNPRPIEHERDDHLFAEHRGAWIAPHLLLVSYWPSVARV